MYTLRQSRWLTSASPIATSVFGPVSQPLIPSAIATGLKSSFPRSPARILEHIGRLLSPSHIISDDAAWLFDHGERSVAFVTDRLRLQITLRYARLGLAPQYIVRPSHTFHASLHAERPARLTPNSAYCHARVRTFRLSVLSTYHHHFLASLS